MALDGSWAAQQAVAGRLAGGRTRWEMTAIERESDGGAHRDRASASPGREGASPRVTEYRDWPVAKGCIPPMCRCGWKP